ncbi:MAG: FAD-dependent oxidoreductase, partial [Arenicellales bacterium]
MKEYPRYDFLVIGSGPAGKAAAIQAAKLGFGVAVVDGQPQVGGVCVHTGTIPSKTLRETVLNLTGWRERGFYGKAYRVKQDIDAADLMQRLAITLRREVEILKHQLNRNGVDVVTGFAQFTARDAIEVTPPDGDPFEIKADKFVVAVGTRTYRPDYIPFDGRTVVDSDEVLKMEKLPRTMTVIGAGVIGVEYATIFRALDIAVTLVEPRGSMLDFMDREIVMQFRHEVSDIGLRLQFGQKVKEVVRKKNGGCIV